MMYRPSLALLCMAFVCSTTTAAMAADPPGMMLMPQAATTAKAAVSGSVPIKVQLKPGGGSLLYEVKTFSGLTLYEVVINPKTGAVVKMDASSGGGAMGKITTAKAVMSQSQFTLTEAMTYVGALYPDHVLTEIEMLVKKGVPIFDIDLVAGTKKTEIHVRASDGAIIKESVSTLAKTSPFYNMVPPPSSGGNGGGKGGGPPNNDGAVKSAPEIIAAMQKNFGGTVYEIELKPVKKGFRYEMRMLSDKTIYKRKVNAQTGAVQSTKKITKSKEVTPVKNSMNNAAITLTQAIAVAEKAVPGGAFVEAKLRLQDDGKAYAVKLTTGTGAKKEVKIHSVTGAVLSVKNG